MHRLDLPGREEWAWRLKATNGYILATDGGQGYNNRADADSVGRRLLSGEFSVGN